MTRLRNLKGPTKYVVWSLSGLVLGFVYVLLTTPLFDSGPAWNLPVFGFLMGIVQAFYAGRRDRKESHPNQPPAIRTRDTS
jgi:membrane associated rhomboid family serine protease